MIDRMAVILPAVLLLHWASVAQGAPSLVLFNGTINTVDDRNQVVQAVAVRGNTIAAVGTDDEILALAREATRRIDLGGKTVVPGFIDAHGHLLGLGQSLQVLDFVGTTDYGQIVAQVAEKARTTPEGQWITGRGWDQNDWPEKAFPQHEALSRATSKHPVFLTRIDGHAGLANAVALTIAGITRENADPPGGKIVRDARGEPTGVLVDSAQGLVQRHIPPLTPSQVRDAVSLAIRECLRHGLTSVHDPGVSSANIEIYKSMIDAGQFDLRVYAMVAAANPRDVREYLEKGRLLNYGGHRLTVRSRSALGLSKVSRADLASRDSED